MANKSMIIKPVAAAIGVAFVSSMFVSTAAVANDNPFATADLNAGYMLAGDKDKEGKCGEGKCGADKQAAKDAEGSCGASKGEEGSCGESKGEEGSCGGDKAEGEKAEGDKGEEGSCGGNA